MSKSPRILFFDIETTPIKAYVWALWDQNIPLNQIKDDWFVLSWSARWSDQKDVSYEDLRQGKKKFSIKNEKKMLQKIWKLLDEADVVVTQNGIKFDVKKLNARFWYYGMSPPSSFQHFDTLKVSKKHFALTSHKLEYMCNYLNLPFKKLKHKKYPGFGLWDECLNNNNEAWEEMKSYNNRDVLALESLYYSMAPWEPGIFKIEDYTGVKECKCGSKNFTKYGFAYKNQKKYQRYKCSSCGGPSQDTKATK